MTTAHHEYVGGRLHRLLVCFDGSEESKQAAELALELGKRLTAELTVFSVFPDISHLETIEARAAAERAARDRLTTNLAPTKLRAVAEGVKLTEASVSGGDPADQIAAYADEHGFDLVVIGSHGQERATHGGLGRVLERLVRDPHFPVLVTPDRPRG
jgi:nucleotide-binding universal stress UspA family protein